MLTISIPGVAYYECFDPNASSMASEIGLPEPKVTKVGKGHRFTYEDVTREQALEVADHLCGMGELWLDNTAPDETRERNNYRRLIATGERLREEAENHEITAIHKSDLPDIEAWAESVVEAANGWAGRAERSSGDRRQLTQKLDGLAASARHIASMAAVLGAAR